MRAAVEVYEGHGALYHCYARVDWRQLPKKAAMTNISPTSISDYVFLSHSWKHKSLANRIAHRLAVQGVNVWIDEEQMVLMNNIPLTLRAKIRGSKLLLVALTKAAATSRWVQMEVEAANEQPGSIPILPLICEEGVSSPLLDVSMALDLTDPLTFDDQLRKIPETVFPMLGVVPKPLDRPARLSGLKAYFTGKPEILSVIDSLISQPGITHAQFHAITPELINDHDLEYLLMTLFEGVPEDKDKLEYIASLCSFFIPQRGCGGAVVARYLTRKQYGTMGPGTVLTMDGFRDRKWASLALRLFLTTETVYHNSFMFFIKDAFDLLSEDERSSCARYVTRQDDGPGSSNGSILNSAFELFERMPDNPILRSLWHRWATRGDFSFAPLDPGRKTEAPRMLFHFIGLAKEDRFLQFDFIADDYHNYFRFLVRSRNAELIREAINALRDAFSLPYIYRDKLVRLAMEASERHEWTGWEEGRTALESFRKAIEAIASDADLEVRSQALYELAAALKWQPYRTAR